MPYEVYKVLHLAAIVFLFLSVGSLLSHLINGGEHSTNKSKKMFSIIHGVAIFFILLSGFGLLARLGMNTGWGVWVWVKLGVWAFFAAAPFWIKKCQSKALSLLFTSGIVFTIAAYFAINKPF